MRGVHWQARRAVTGALAGTHHSKQRGTSAEFTEYRLYRQGDDPRRIDWRLLARSDRAYIRLATDRAILPTMIVLDASASMAFPVATRDKWRRAREIAVGLAAVAHADGDPVGVAVAERSRTDARRSAAHAARRRRRDRASRRRGAAEGANALAPTVAAMRTPRIAIITDLLGDADGVAARRARARCRRRRSAPRPRRRARRDRSAAPPMLAADPEQPTLQRLLAEATRAGYDASLRRVARRDGACSGARRAPRTPKSSPMSRRRTPCVESPSRRLRQRRRR